MDIIHVIDIVLIGIAIPRMVAAYDLQMAQFFCAGIDVFHESQSIVLQIRQSVDDWLVGAAVGVNPIVEDVFDAEAELIAEIFRSAVVAHNRVGGAVDVEDSDWSHCGVVSHVSGNESADRCCRVDTVAILDCHSVRHETAHREACKEYTVLIYRILRCQRVEQCHQEAGVIGGAGGETGVPHGAVAFVQSLRNYDYPTEVFGNLLEMELVVQTCDIIAQAMKIKHYRK